MNKLIFSLLFIFCYASPLIAQHHPNALDPIYTNSMHGRVDIGLKIIDTLNISKLSSKHQSFVKKYKDRFSGNNLHFEYTDNDQINELLKLFHSYWIHVFTKPAEQKIADKNLEEKVISLLKQQPQFAKLSKGKLAKSTSDYCNQYIESLGYYGNAFGKTAHIRDIFLWKKTDTKQHDITLLDNQVSVEVNEMSGFVSKGCLGFATFDRSHAGGWASKEALFAVIESYDTTSEDYEISYLHHEGQHFSDYQNFPKLKGPDLEYRAKLTELVLLNDGFWDKLDRFIRNGANLPNQAHPIANFRVIEHLSQRLLNKDRETDITVWKSIGKEKIQETCKALYDTHTENLKKKGAKRVKEYIVTAD